MYGARRMGKALLDWQIELRLCAQLSAIELGYHEAAIGCPLLRGLPSESQAKTDAESRWK